MELLYDASRIVIHNGKYFISFLECNEASHPKVANIFPYPSFDLYDGLKHLEYKINPNSYSLNDRGWIVFEVENNITLWCNRWISMGGCLTLIKLVIEVILVY
jgi:hypothetical protein